MMSIRKYLVIWLLLLGSQFLPVSVGRGYHLLITSLTSSSDPNYANVTVTAPRSLINASIESTTTLRKIDLYFRLDIRYSMAEPYRTLINRTIDLCEFFKNPQKDPLTALFFDAIPTNNCNNHIFRACPIKADHYYISNYSWNLEELPSMLPSISFQSKVEAFMTEGTNRKSIIVIEATGFMQWLRRKNKNPL